MRRKTPVRCAQDQMTQKDQSKIQNKEVRLCILTRDLKLEQENGSPFKKKAWLFREISRASVIQAIPQ